MSREETKDLSYDELMALLLRNVDGQTLASNEIQIRLLEAINKSNTSSEKLNTRIYALNWFIGFLTAVSAALTFSLWINPEWKGLLQLLGFND